MKNPSPSSTPAPIYYNHQNIEIQGIFIDNTDASDYMVYNEALIDSGTSELIVDKKLYNYLYTFWEKNCTILR